MNETTMTRTIDFPTTQHAVQLVGPGELKLNPREAGAHARAARNPGRRSKRSGSAFPISSCSSSSTTTCASRRSSPASRSRCSQASRATCPASSRSCRGMKSSAASWRSASEVKQHHVGERCLVQTDYRQLPTAAGSNAAFGYNFDGGLQEYTLLDERVVIAPNGDRFLIPVGEERGASAIALVEPWACVEDSYVTRRAKPHQGRRPIAGRRRRRSDGERASRRAIRPQGHPAEIKRVSPAEVAALPNESFDDIVYFGADKATIEMLNDKLATGGIINLVLGGKKIGEPVSVGVGRVHYGSTRWIGTTGDDAAESYRSHPGDRRSSCRTIACWSSAPAGRWGRCT